MAMQRAFVTAVGTAAILAVGCSSEESRPGQADVYQRIETMTDCAALQREFDQAMENTEARQPGDPIRKVTLSYAKVADERMDKVGCYEKKGN